MPTTVSSTISLTGTPDYSTIQAWESDSPADLVSEDKIWQGVIQELDDNFTGGSTLLTVSGGTTDATRYKELTVAAGSSIFDSNTNALRYNESLGASATQSSGSPTISVQEDYFRISRLQVSCSAATSGANSLRSLATAGFIAKDMMCELGPHVLSVPIFRTDSLLENCYFIAQIGGQSSLINLDVGASTMRNCMVVVPDDLSSATNAVISDVNTNVFENCGFFGMTNIMTKAGQTFTTCYGNDASPPTGCTTIAFDTTTGSGFTNIDDATLDLRLGSDSGLIDVGTDTVGTEDAFGVTRTTSEWDIGPVELVTAAGGGTVSIFDNDGAKAFWIAAGFTGSYNDMQMAYLKDNLSKTGGSNSDLLAAYIKVNGTGLV